MKKIFISAGLLAAGAAGMQNVFADGLDVISPKAWNVSGTLRGFYDDNYATSNTKKGSFGTELTPEISFNVPLQQTDLGIRYIYGLYYYEERDELNQIPIDQTHQIDLWFDHSFNERWKLKVTDSLAIGQEPELLQSNPTTGLAEPFRVAGDNLANHLDVTLNTDWTRKLSTALHYGNSVYDYQNSGGQVAVVGSSLVGTGLSASTPFTAAYSSPLNPGLFGIAIPGSVTAPSLAGLLDRVEQSASLDVQWHFQPETMGFIGYSLGLVNYTGNEPISVFNYFDVNGTQKSLVRYSSSRDAITHYGYVGVKHEFTPNLSGKVSIGASYTDNYNDPLGDTTSVSPYVDLNVSYTYLPGSYIQLGFTHDQNATDVATVDQNGSQTDYQESSVLYFDINHRITPKLLATAVARYQYSDYVGGTASSSDSSDYALSLNLNYQINNHFSAEVGYNFDQLVSGPDGTYDRNRVYIGMSANY